MKSLMIFTLFFVSMFIVDASADSYVYDETIGSTVINENDGSMTSQYDFFEIDRPINVRSTFLQICGDVSIRHDLIFIGNLNSNMDKNILIENGEAKKIVAENCYNEKYYFHSKFNVEKKGSYKVNVMVKSSNNDFKKIDEYFFRVSEFIFFHPGIIFTEHEATPYTSLTPKNYFTDPEKIIANDTFEKMCGEVSITHEWTDSDGFVDSFYSTILGASECTYGEVSFVSELSENIIPGKYTVKSIVDFSEGVILSYTNSFRILEEGLYYNKTVFWNGLGDVAVPKVVFVLGEDVFINTSFFQVCSDINVKYVLNYPDDTEEEFIPEIMEVENCESARSTGTVFMNLLQPGMYTVEVLVYSTNEYVTLETIKFVIGDDTYPTLFP